MPDKKVNLDAVKKALTFFNLGEPYSIGALGGTATPKFAVEVPEGRFVLRIRPDQFAHEDMIRFDHESLWRLVERGLPVPCPRKRSDGTSWIRLAEGVYEVLSWVEGKPFKWEDLVAVANVGQFLARFHSVLADDIPLGKEGMLREDHPDLLDGYIRMLKGLCSDKDRLGQIGRIGDQLEMVRSALDGELYPRLPKAVIHGDIHPGNIKFMHSRVSAVYDFDYLSLQARVRDVVDALMFFAAHRDKLMNPDDIYSLTQPFAFDFERAKVLLSSYQRLGKVVDVEWEAMPWLVRSQWIQIRLRGSRKVPQADKVSFVLDRFFEMIEWLDQEADDFFGRLQARLVQ